MRRLCVMLALALVLTACGDDGGTNPFATGTAPSSSTEATTTTRATATTTEAVTTTTSTTTTTTTTAPTTTTTQATTTTTVPPGDEELPPGDPYSEYQLLTNAAGSLEVEVPVEWFDVYDGPYTIGEQEVGVALAASTSHEGLITSFTTPGVFIGASSDPDVTAELIFSTKDFSSLCTDTGRDSYDDGEYAGEFQVWENCDGTMSDFVVIVAEPYAGGAIALVEITLVTTADRDALDRILATWRITGEV